MEVLPAEVLPVEVRPVVCAAGQRTAGGIASNWSPCQEDWPRTSDKTNFVVVVVLGPYGTSAVDAFIQSRFILLGRASFLNTVGGRLLWRDPIGELSEQTANPANYLPQHNAREP